MTPMTENMKTAQNAKKSVEITAKMTHVPSMAPVMKMWRFVHVEFAHNIKVFHEKKKYPSPRPRAMH